MDRLTPPTRRARRSAAGFTLVEILISLGIFLIGMTAVVSLFPAAAILQRETTQEVIGEMAAQSAAAIIEAQKLTYAPGTPGTGDLSGYYAAAGYADTDVVSLHTVNANLLINRYTVADRSYPTLLGNGANAADCDLHWIPFIQDLNGDQAGSQNWVVRLFLVESDSRVTYPTGNPNDANPNDATYVPKVRFVAVSAVAGDTFTLAAAVGMEPGDVVMDSNGNDHVVVEVVGNNVTVLNSIALTPNSPNKLWYAPKFGGTSSPARRVVTVQIDVVSP